MSYPKRGSVWLVNLDPAVGAEIQKRRPAVVISNNVANQYSPVVIVVAISSRKQAHVDEILISPPEGGLRKSSVILSNQIRTVDKIRLVKQLGELSAVTMARLKHALMISIGLIDF